MQPQRISTFESIVASISCSQAPLASTPWWQYVFILAWKPDGTIALAMFGGVIDMNNFAAAVERALHQTYCLEGASKSFHVDFESYDSMLKTLGIKCVGSCFYCGRLGENYQKCPGCHFVRYCGKMPTPTLESRTSFIVLYHHVRSSSSTSCRTSCCVGDPFRIRL